MFSHAVLCIIYAQAETVALYLNDIFLSRGGPILHHNQALICFGVLVDYFISAETSFGLCDNF